ncbi:MAG TPA: PQQ-dependent sugar dehydrogenase [Verrucomicrobiae bacterium]|nr:PQQ-dependent sugar dehydrogenase [Verrucomicrobiae bacterium]
MGRRKAIIVCGLLVASGRIVAALPALDLELVTSNVTNAVYITHAGDGSGRLFIVEQPGRIKIFDGTNLLATPFLDISPQVRFSGEEGLLSVAFDPGFATNGQFFVYFTQPDMNNVVARFTAAPPSANTVNTNTMVTVLHINHPTNTNHNGGQMQFGPDGYLYIGTGDGGSGCDPPNNAQNLGVLLGKMLRIDVSNSSTNYTIPPGNPFIATNGALPEIWAYGLRNPWRFSFDRATGDLWIGDVGQSDREEVDLQSAGSPGGQNYGWRLYEGFLTNTCSVTFSNVPTVLPILDYDHSLGRCAIMGGYRYRGAKIAPLTGTYFYADECGGQIYAVTNSGSGWISTLVTNSGLTITTFGEDEAGEVYLSNYATSGAIYRIIGRDSVGDGIADWWRQQYFGTNATNSASCALCDPDGDRFNNLQEYTAGTDPTNSLSALRIRSIAAAGSNVTVDFDSVSGHTYRLERTDNLGPATWTPVVNNVAGTGSIVPVTDTGGASASNRFYRIRLTQ